MNTFLSGASLSGLAAALMLSAACGSTSNNNNTEAQIERQNIEAGLAADAAPLDHTAIPNLPANTWQWVPVEGALCRDGSPTGIGVSANPNSKNLMIYLEGGGACFNSLTCLANPSSYGATEFNNRFGNPTSGAQGILDRNDPANPVADWNMVYVPYCTGDIHAGNATDQMVPGVTGAQQFVGYTNMTRDLARLIATFPHMDKVLLTGISAGGFGAAVNYEQTADTFAPTPVYDLDDSGPPMEDPYATKCLQQQWSQLWGFDKTFLATCGSDCPDPTNYTIDAVKHIVKKYPNIPFGLVDSVDDGIITTFFGFGQQNCTSVNSVDPATYKAGLLDEETQLAAYKNVGGFIFPGSVHTTLGSSSYDTRTTPLVSDDGGAVDGTDGGSEMAKLSDWVTTLVNQGTVSNVGL